MTHHPTPTRHDQAFEIYRSLGPKRTYGAVARQMGVSLSSVKSWASRGRWRERIGERELATAREDADQALSDTAEDREQQRKIIRLALVKLARAIVDGKVRFQGADLDRLIRLSIFVDGGTTGGPDPTRKADVIRFLESVPEDVLQQVVHEVKGLRLVGMVLILPDNHRDPVPADRYYTGN